ncbi:MAG: hypothetical protein NVS3B5_19140 [Sphingomicrobium sp.]
MPQQTAAYSTDNETRRAAATTAIAVTIGTAIIVWPVISIMPIVPVVAIVPIMIGVGRRRHGEGGQSHGDRREPENYVSHSNSSLRL